MLARQRLVTRPPAWVVRDFGGKPAHLDFDFANGRYWSQDLGDFTNYGAAPDTSGTRFVTTSRASVAYIDDLAGIWHLVAANMPRVTNKGVLIEEARTNDALWCRDMTNVVWTAVNMTTAKTATGIDGAANSASTLTATAGNATILQAITLGSQADTYSVWLQRVSGSGTINITVDNGTTWTAAAVTGTWTQFQVTKTAANPIIGIRIVTNGDAVAADFNQLEPGGFATSPILTTSATVTRAADAVTVTKPPTFGSAYTLFAKAIPSPATTTTAGIAEIDNGTAQNRLVLFRNTSNQGQGGSESSNVFTSLNPAVTWTTSTMQRIAGADAASSQAVYFGGGSATSAVALPIGVNVVRLGVDIAANYLDGYLSRVVIWPTTRQPNAFLQAITGTTGP